MSSRRRTRVAALAVTLSVCGAAAIAPQSATAETGETVAPAAAAGPLAELVLVETETANGPFGAVSLTTVNTDGTPSTKNPVPLPTDQRAGHHPLTLDVREGNAGHLNRTADGRYLTIAGWDREPGSGSSDDGTVARIDALGGVDTTTTLGDSFANEFANSVVSPDGQVFFASGEGEDSSDNSGLARVELGGDDPAPWTSTLMRGATTAKIIDGDIYVGTMRVSPYGLAKIGEGIPAAPAPHVSVFGQEVENRFGSDIGAFALLDLSADVPGVDTAYVANGGIQKLTFDGQRWSMRGPFRQLGAVSAFIARPVGDTVELFLVRGEAAGNQLVRVVDAAPWFATPIYQDEQVLKTAEGTRTFRGLDFAPDDWNPKPALPAPATEVAVVEINSASTGTQASSVSIQRYGTQANSYRGQIQLPGAATATSPALTLAPNSVHNGGLSRSADGRFLLLATNTAPVGPRVATPTAVVRLDGQGAADTSTVLSGTFAAATGNPWEVASTDGTKFWLTGQNANSVRYAEYGNTTSAQVDVLPAPGIVIAGDRLYTGGNVNGGNATIYQYDPALPTGTATRSNLIALPAMQSDFELLDLTEDVPGVDTLYYSASAGLSKMALVDGVWTAVGARAGVTMTHLTAQRVLGGVELYGTPSDGSRLLKVTDTAAWNAAPAIADPITMATATPGTVLRGVAFPPNGAWPATIPPLASARPSIQASSTGVVGTALNPRNPTLGINLADRDTPAANLTLTITSSNQAVLPDAGVTVQGTGAARRLFFAPIDDGSSTVTVTVTDPQGNATTVSAGYTAEPAVADTSIFFYYGVDDISSAVDVGDNYILGVTDESNSPVLYRRQRQTDVVQSGTSAVRTIGVDGLPGGEADYEGMARAGDLIYLFASHGNDKGGGSEPDRARFDVVKVTGTGANIQLERVGGTETLKAQLHAWDAGNGHGLGADALGFVAGSRGGVIPNPPDGFNIEGVEMGPSSTSTIYLAWRAPTVVRDGKPHALIVPVTNIDTYALGEDEQAEFGDPIFLDLDGRSIRDIRKNTDDHYVISAGPGNGTESWALYTWDGQPGHQPVLDQLLPDENEAGTWETIPSVPSPAVAGAQIELLTDAGDADGNQRSFGKMFTLTGGPRPGFLTVDVRPRGTSATVTVDGVVRDSAGLDGLALPDGEHEVCVLETAAHLAPPCETVTVDGDTGAHVVLDLAARSRLSVRWNAAAIGNRPVTISVDGVPVNDGTTGTIANIPAEPGERLICWSVVNGFSPPACQLRQVAPGGSYAITGNYTANADAAPYTGPTGMLRVVQTGSVIAPSIVIVDGKTRSTFGLDWMRIAPGQHEVCWTDVAGFVTPDCQTVTVSGARTTTVEAAFTQAATLRVTTNAPYPAQILVDGVAYDGWGVWTNVPAGAVQVSFGAVPGHTTPAPQTVTLAPGETATVAGSYVPAS